MKFPQRTVTQKLFLYILITSLIPLSIIAYFSYNISNNAINEEVYNFTISLMQEKKKYLELIMEEIESLIANISSFSEIRDVLKEDKNFSIYEKLNTQAKMGYILSGYINLRGLLSIDIFSQNNQHYHVGETLDTENFRKNVKDEIFRETINSEKNVKWLGIIQNVNETSMNEKVISASKIIKIVDDKTKTEKNAGILIVNYSLDTFYEHFDKIYANNQTYMIADSKNIIMYDHDKSLIGTNVNKELMDSIKGDSGYFEKEINDEKMFVAFDRENKSGWIMISLIPVKNLQAKIISIRNNAFILLFFCFIITGIVSYIISRQIVSPIKKITSLFIEMKEGNIDLKTRLEEKTTDEIGVLVKWFNVFLESLEEKKKTEEELKFKKEQLEELNKTLEERVIEEVKHNREKDLILVKQSRQAAMGEMIGNIAHQWRQPLNALGITIQNIKEAYDYKELDEEYINKSVKKSMELIGYMSGTIDDFRNFFKPDKEKINFNLNELIKKSLSFVEASFANHSIQIYLESYENVYIEGYPNEYSQVILNILNNAKDILIEKKVSSPFVRIKINKKGDKSEVLISDNGGGIPGNIMDKIFEPYFTTKGQGKGTGLGLYMSKMIIEKNMNGKIEVYNTNEGAEFKIEI